MSNAEGPKACPEVVHPKPRWGINHWKHAQSYASVTVRRARTPCITLSLTIPGGSAAVDTANRLL